MCIKFEQKNFGLLFHLIILLNISFTLFAQSSYDLETKLTASEVTTHHYFGASTDIDNNNIIIGALGNDACGLAAYIYNFDLAGWSQRAILLPDTFSWDGFGRSVAISGNAALVGAPTDDPSGTNAGAVWVYRFNGDQWETETKLTASDPGSNDNFGFDVDIDDNFAVIGAYTDDDTSGASNTGSAYIFQYNGFNWIETAKLTASDGDAYDFFGRKVAINGNTVLIGATNDDGVGNAISNQGAVYVFTFNGISWTEQAKLAPSDGAPGDIFGSSISIDGNRFIASSPGKDDSGYDVGAAYVYEFNGTNWIEKQKLTASDGAEGDWFGVSVSLSDRLAVIGAHGDDDNGTSSGSTYLFKYNGLVWEENFKIAASDGEANDSYGESVAVYDKIAVIGAPGDDDYGDNSGAAYVYELIAQPILTNISNGSYKNYAKINWDNRSRIVENFKVFRDNEEIATTFAGARTYNDYDAAPGKIYNYDIVAYHSLWGESRKGSGRGWRRTNGRIDGNIRTTMGSGVRNVDVSLLPTASDISNVLDFNGVDDFVQVPNSNDFDVTNWTIEAWIFPRGSGDIIYRAPDSLKTFNIFYNEADQNIALVYNDALGNEYSLVSNTNSVPQNNWSHIAGVLDSSSISIFINGQFNISTPVSSAPNTGNATVKIGTGESGYFNGLIDEIRFWSTARDSIQLLSNKNRILQGDEAGLIAYWTFDDSSRSTAVIAGDYAENGGHHGTIYGTQWVNDTINVRHRINSDPTGFYSIRNIYFDESREFEITPNKGDHGFDPEYHTRTLESTAPTLTGVNFTDTTSFAVIGKIQYANTTCNVKGVEILLNGNWTGVYTNANGVFKLTIEQAGTYTITPVFGDSSVAHSFSPVDTTLYIDSDVLNMQFWDTESHLLYGKVRAACNAVVGRATINLRSIEHNWGNYDTTFTTDNWGNFRLFFPAQKYYIDVVDLDPYNPFIIQYFDSDTVDLSWGNDGKAFIYRTAPVIRILGFEDVMGGGEYQIPILEQYANYRITIEVLDVYESDTCYVDSGTVTIYDNVGGDPSHPITLELQDGKTNYEFIPMEPNILGGGSFPYQKLMQFVAHVGQENSSLEQWTMVTGHRPREQTFTSTSPELPLLILRDPPGDESYCYQTKDSTITSSYVQSTLSDKTTGEYSDLKIGAVVEFGVSGLWWSVGTEFGAYYIQAEDYYEGESQEERNSVMFSFTATEEFRTSDDQLVVGPKGDVFVGASFNNIFAITDVIDFDWQTNQVILDTSLVWGIESFNTTYIYTEHHIKNTLIPQLKTLRTLVAGDTALMAQYDASIALWEQILAKNASLKNVAEFERNISFSAGTSTSYTTTTTTESSLTFDYISYVDESFVQGLGIVQRSTPMEWGWETKWRWSTQVIRSNQTVNTTTIGYHFGDDDPGDYFSVDVKRDKAGFGTPVFELAAGTSSCPWEEGSQPRDGVQLGINTYVQYDVPPDDPASFILFLGNTSQSSEEREYHLRVIQGSNPDGAEIKVAGVPMGNYLSYYIPAGQQFNASLTVERGPLSYDYENLQVMFYPPCQYEFWQNNMPIMIADTVTFSVHFQSPLSPITLLMPEDNWVLNQSDNDTMQIIITDYDINEPYLESIKFQYRRYGESWQTAYLFPKANLPNEYILEYWDVSGLTDGNYELRAAADCGSQGIRYSSVASGIIDRRALIVLGYPQPSDGILNLGENISIAFSSDIDYSSIRANQNVLLIRAIDSSQINISVTTYDNTLFISPLDSLTQYENEILIATISNIKDIYGNQLRKPINWSFRVSRNPVYWTVSNIDTTVYQNEPANFIRTLKNASNQSESFTIIRYPSWLTPSPLNGNIPYGGTRKINFTIDTQLIVDSLYIDTVFVATTFGEEYLIVTLSVLHKPPEWTVNPSFYTYNMNIIAQVVFEDGLAKDVYDIVSVFVGDECRGKAHIEYVSVVNKYITFLTIYSNTASGEVLNFHTWDASKGRESVLISGNYTFQFNASLGTVSNPILIEPDAFVQSLELNQGWNWISLNVENTDMSLTNVMNSLSPADGDLIKSQTGFSQYLTGAGWQGNLVAINNTQSYGINLSKPDTLYFTGLPVDVFNTPLAIDSGWNWISYLSQEILDVNYALKLYSASGNDRIKSQTSFADYVASSGTWEGSLKKMLPGQGYLLKSQRGGNLNYPVLHKTTDITQTDNISFPEKPEWCVNYCDYEYSMSITSIFEFDEKEMCDSTFIIGAFSGETCRGVAQLKYLSDLKHYMAFLLVYSNSVSGDSIHFKIFEPVSEKLRDVEETLIFNSDQVIGNLEVPFAFTALAIGDELVPYSFYLKQNYPNPFNPITTIEYGLPRNEKVNLTIYDILGKKVKTLVNKTQKAGRYKVKFDISDHALASGVYFYRIDAGSFVKTRKFVIVK